MASENLRSLLWNRGTLGIHGNNLRDPPRKGDYRRRMFHTHGRQWCAWQEVWLDGLLGLHDTPLYILCGFEFFVNKFRTPATLDENGRDERISFDATWNLPAGTVARNILDWERLQLLQASQANPSLRIVYLAERGKTLQRPIWYTDSPAEEDFSKPLYLLDGTPTEVFQYKFL